ncbi:hypothetical protein [Pseudoalteromonas denitrificans]|uniref:Uncharacterized protein n=1 Tax=Pseudoalteromonas denitrificans DSM 6059 TaxID=1123010 RepID=A0A1I1LTN2_9GAMM|nr:hypothetical protein [Pseudoalteromonas denitrificans]SFC76409.1 hypothetical protein SAMN02745724_02504 [Pseudoalteromonas denitrificans DSM 6059]
MIQLKFNKFKHIVLCFFLLGISACNGNQYKFQAFSYPSSIPPHEDGWKYKAIVSTMTASSGSMFRQSDKKVNIKIVDSKNKILLSDNHDLEAVSGVKVKVQWKDAKVIDIQFSEYGSVDVDDTYSKLLAETGEKKLGAVTYEMDSSSNQFKYVSGTLQN